MASDFIGYTILVTLQSPPDAQVQGVVADVAGQTLILRDATWLGSGRYLPTYHVESSAIADLEVSPHQTKGGSLPDNPGPSFSTENIRQIHLPNYVYQELGSTDPNLPPQPSRKSPQQPFVDPAILSFTKPAPESRPVPRSRIPTSQSTAVSPVLIAESHKLPSINSPQSRNESTTRRGALAPLQPSYSSKVLERRDSSATATLTGPFDHMALSGDAALSDLPGSPVNGLANQKDAAASATVGKASIKKSRRGGNRKSKDAASHSIPGLPDFLDPGVTPVATIKTNAKGKGWRQTPLVEETPPLKANRYEKRSKHKLRNLFLSETNGWATEDATDIQDLGDFDFQENLSKFDKSRVFDEIRRDDTTADDERLVSFNRKANPGTNGGKNLHYTENVLGPQEAEGNIWKSEAGETEEDEILEDHYSSGRGSRRGASKRTTASRKGSIVPPSLSQTRGMSRTESPRSKGRLSAAVSPMNGSVSTGRASLRLVSTNKPCTCVSPLQMIEIEQLCTSELGLTEDMLAENAGRGIATAALTQPPSLTMNPVVLFLIGNHKSGARAVAGARHLRNRGVRVSLCVLGGEREEMLLESLRRQLDAYKRSGGWVVRWDELQTKLVANPESLPELVVDALLGMHVTFSELRTDDQAIAFEMVRWANRSSIPILSVDVPSGLIASSGEVGLADSAPLILHAKYIVCLGAPKAGLLYALVTGDREFQEWQLVVADIGISNVAWRKYGTRRRHGFDFGTEWVVGLKFVNGGSSGA